MDTEYDGELQQVRFQLQKLDHMLFDMVKKDPELAPTRLHVVTARTELDLYLNELQEAKIDEDTKKSTPKIKHTPKEK